MTEKNVSAVRAAESAYAGEWFTYERRRIYGINISIELALGTVADSTKSCSPLKMQRGSNDKKKREKESSRG